MRVAGKGAEVAATGGKGMPNWWALCSASDSNPGLLGGTSTSESSSEIICTDWGKGKFKRTDHMQLNPMITSSSDSPSEDSVSLSFPLPESSSLVGSTSLLDGTSEKMGGRVLQGREEGGRCERGITVEGLDAPPSRVFGGLSPRSSILSFVVWCLLRSLIGLSDSSPFGSELLSRLVLCTDLSRSRGVIGT